MADSGRDSECPYRKGPEDIQTGEWTSKLIPTLITSIPSHTWVSMFKVSVSDTTEDLYLSLTVGSLLYTFPSLTGSCATIDYMHRSIPEIIKVESELVIFLEKAFPGISWQSCSRVGFTAEARVWLQDGGEMSDQISLEIITRPPGQCPLFTEHWPIRSLFTQSWRLF